MWAQCTDCSIEVLDVERMRFFGIVSVNWSQIIFTPQLNITMCLAIWNMFPISSNILPAKRNTGTQRHTAGRHREKEKAPLDLLLTKL